MALITKKARLTHHLGTEKTLLILFGNDAVTKGVHKFAKTLEKEGSLASELKPVRVADLTTSKDTSVLTSAQKKEWGVQAGSYAVSRPNKAAVREVLVTGPVTDLLRKTADAKGKRPPSVNNIRLAFRGGPK